MTAYSQIPDFAAARLAMVENQLRPEGVVDPAVLDAMGSIPREKFVPEQVRPLAYADRALPLGDGRFLAAPAVHGQLLGQMMPERGQSALVVGAGTGYSTSVLKAIGLEVTAVENAPELVAAAKAARIAVVEAPLETGDPANGAFDQILIDGAVEFIPDAIVAQLADGGRLGAALIGRGITRLVVGRKSGGAFGYLSIGDAGVPALPGFRRPQEFTF